MTRYLLHFPHMYLYLFINMDYLNIHLLLYLFGYSLICVLLYNILYYLLFIYLVNILSLHPDVPHQL